jgi:hypothetical protein
MTLKKKNDKDKYFKICVEIQCEHCKKKFVVPLDRFMEGKDFCSLHCNTQYQENKKQLFFDHVEKVFQWRTHQEKDMLQEKRD